MLSGAKTILLDSVLGSEYTRVEYVGNYKTKGVFDTGFKFKNSKTYKLKFKANVDYGYGVDLIGSVSSSDFVVYCYRGSLTIKVGSLTQQFTISSNNTYELVIPCGGVASIYQNDVLVEQGTVVFTEEPTIDTNIFLFSHGDVTDTSIHDDAKIYSLQVFDNTTNVKELELIPYVSTSKVACFYNPVSREILTPIQGTSIAGPSVDGNGNLLINKLTEIPVSYTLCDYLESTGTQYIDTGFIPSNLSGLHGIFSYGENASTTSFCGLHTDDWVFSLPNSTGTRRKGFERSLSTISETIEQDAVVDSIFNINNRTILTVGNKTSTFDFDDSYTFTAQTSLLIFANKENTTIHEQGNMKGYLLEIYHKGQKVHKFIPCLDTNGTPCFFDTITGETLYNAGTGDFLYKITDFSNRLPVEYTRLDYAASMGNVSVKTDYTLNDVDIDITAQAIYKRNNNYLFGNYNYTGGKHYYTTYYSNAWAGGIGGGEWRVSPEISCLEKHTIYASPSAGYFIDGDKKVDAYGTCTIPNNMILFSRYNGVSTVEYGYWKIFDCKLSSSTTSSHIIPVKKYNCVLMYDMDAKKELKPTNMLYGGPEVDIRGNVKLRNTSRIPESYTELEWIESDGTPYIQTDVIPQSSYVYDTIAGTRSDSATGTVFWGSRGADDTTACYLSSTKGQSIKLITAGSTSTGNYDTGVVAVVDALNVMTGMTTSPDHVQSMQPISLFAFNKNGTIDKAVGKVKIALFRVKDSADNDKFVCELIPCLDSTGIPCFYDTVSTNTYYNIGGGKFSYKKKTIYNVTSSVGDYVQDGLIAMWDGIENFGYGLHDKESKIWKNLGSLGGYFNATRSLVNTKNNAQTSKYGDNRYIWFTRTGALQRDYMKSEYTYEIVFTPSKDFTRVSSSLLGYYADGVGVRGYEIVDNGANVIMGVDGNFNCNYMSKSIIDFEVPQTMTMVASLSAGRHTVYKNTFQNGWKSVNGNHTLTNAAAMIIGADRNESGRTFAGDIHCVRIYNRPLTQDEIRQNFKVDKKRFKFTDFTLPDGLTQVEYLQNTVYNHNGISTEFHSYFEIPRTYLDPTDFEVKVMFEPVELRGVNYETLAISDWMADNVRTTRIIKNGSSTAGLYINHDRNGYWGTGFNTIALVGNTFCITTRRSNALVNGSSIGLGAPEGPLNTNPLKIYSHGISKFYYLTIFDSNKKPVLNLIPVRNGDVGCLYDTINGTIFENLGDTAYTCGPDVL